MVRTFIEGAAASAAASLTTISLLGSTGHLIPVAVVNWDEAEDGDLEILVVSKMFQDYVGIELVDRTGLRLDPAAARLVAARTHFIWREPTESEARGWAAALAECDDGDDCPLFMWDPRDAAN